VDETEKADNIYQMQLHEMVNELTNLPEIRVPSYLAVERILQVISSTQTLARLSLIDANVEQPYQIWNTPGYYYTIPLRCVLDAFLEFEIFAKRKSSASCRR